MDAAPHSLNRLTILNDLAALERQERDLSQLRRKLHDQIDRGFGNENLLTKERHLSIARRGLHERIDELRAQLELLDALTSTY